MKRSPVCFIAMAFGWEDTDAFYEKQLLPTLKRNGIKPVIINRHQSNDDINFQIFEQLDQADFCIADLTYTRPSVYFEAGYAQRSVPVIYTVRKDHLGKGQPEDLRVHFDLQMKPIIVWSTPNDLTFSSRLEKRLEATVLRDWNKKRETSEKYEIAKKQFLQLSQYEKLYRIRRLALSAMKKNGINLSKWERVNFDFSSDTSHDIGAYPKKSIDNGYIDHVFGTKKTNNKIVEISIQTYSSISKKDLWDLQGAYYGGVYNNYLKEKYKKSPLFLHNIALSLQPITSKQIESVLKSFSPLVSSKIYLKKSRERSLQSPDFPERTIVNTFHFLSGIESELHLQEMLNNVIDNYILQQIKERI